MKTEHLIEKLIQTNRPVKRLTTPVLSFLKWAFVSMLCMGVGVSLFGLISDLESVVFQNGFTFQFLCSLMLALMSALSAFILSVPDEEKTWVNILPLATLALWLLSISQSFYFNEIIKGGIGVNCVRDIVVLSIVPAALLFAMLRRAAPLNKGKVGTFAALSVASLGALGTQFICHNDDPLHLILWHYLPVLFIGFSGFFLGKFLLNWER